MLKNRVGIICKEGNFEADILLEQKADFHNCYRCGGDGRWTFLKAIQEIVDMAVMEEVSVRSKIGKVIKNALLEKMDSRYLCEDCAKKNWKITI